MHNIIQKIICKKMAFIHWNSSRRNNSRHNRNSVSSHNVFRRRTNVNTFIIIQNLCAYFSYCYRRNKTFHYKFLHLFRLAWRTFFPCYFFGCFNRIWHCAFTAYNAKPYHCNYYRHNPCNCNEKASYGNYAVAVVLAV